MPREKKVLIKLTKDQALIIWHQIDGWLDAGSCDGGLEDEEIDAMEAVLDQISEQTS